jgi:hypothetical protein
MNRNIYAVKTKIKNKDEQGTVSDVHEFQQQDITNDI